MSVSVCAIDPGAGGGIAFYKNQGNGLHTVMAVNMPQTNKDIWDYLTFLKETYGPFVLFIERVAMWKGDLAVGGKAFGIDKMMANYNSLIAIIEVNNIPLVEVSPVTWQKDLQLFFPLEKKKMEPGKYKQFRKNKYKRYAAVMFPTLKPTLKTADALCILQFGIGRLALSSRWVKDNVKNPGAFNLFNS